MPLKGSHSRLYARSHVLRGSAALQSFDRGWWRGRAGGGACPANPGRRARRHDARRARAGVRLPADARVEPFAYPAARRYPLAELVSDIGAEYREDAVARVDPATDPSSRRRQRALLRCAAASTGATLRPHFEHAVTIDNRRLDEQLHGLIQDVEGGYVSKLAFVAPTRMPWPLPMYELALLTARRAWDMNTEVSITLVTPEDSPLAIFGPTVSQTVERLLVERGIFDDPLGPRRDSRARPGLASSWGAALAGRSRGRVAGAVRARDSRHSEVRSRRIHPCRSALRGRRTGSRLCRGDATEFPVKHGGIAAQQADAAAEAMRLWRRPCRAQAV